MEQAPRSVVWEAPEYHHTEKGVDWFLILIIVTTAFVVVAIIFDNTLFALLLGLAGIVLGVSAAKRPRIIPYAVSVRGIKINDLIYPYSSLESYRIDEEDPKGPQLYIKSKQRVMPLIVLPIPSEYVDDIESLIIDKLPEEDLEETLLVKILELFGF